MTELRKTIFSTLLSILTLLSIAVFWEQTPLTILCLIVLAVLMILLEENRKSAAILYFIAFLWGPLAEATAIMAGAWTYSAPDLLGFPFWLPFLWGNAGLFLGRTKSYWETVF